jgi:Sigma-70 region 2
MMTYDHTRPARPADVTVTLVASNAIVPAALVAPAAARPGRSADWAVTELYSLHHRGLVRLAVLLVRDVPTAEDVVQDSFVAMHGGWQRLRDAESALAYLRQAVLNRCCGTGPWWQSTRRSRHRICPAPSMARWCSWNGPR